MTDVKFQDGDVGYKSAFLNLLTEIEDAIIAAARANMPYLQTVDTYAGELEDALKNILPKYPCFLTAFDASTFKGDGYPAFFYDHGIQLSVILMDKNLRSDKARRRGTNESAGTYQMISDTLLILAGKTLDIKDIAPFAPVSVNSLLQGKTISAYEMIFKTSIDLQIT